MALLTSSCLVILFALQWFLRGSMDTLDYLLQNHRQWDFAFEYLSRGRAFVPFATPPALGGYLILFAPLSIALLFRNKEEASGASSKLSFKNIFALLGVLLISLALLSTQSLGAILSLMVALGLFVLSQKTTISHKSLVFIFIPFVVLLPFFFFLRNSNLYFFNLPSFSLNSRFAYWHQAIKLIAQHPFVGLGIGNYPFFKSISPHNSYLQIWAETGLLGLVALMGISYQTLKADFSKKRPNERIVYESLWIGNLAFLIHNLVDLTFFLPEVSTVWWAIAALLTTAD